MSFNNGRERRKFEKAWEILRKEYQEAGMDEESIEKMYQYDSLMYNSERRYREHTVDNQESIWESIAVISKEEGDGENSGLDWLDEISDVELYRKLVKLSESDRELLTMYAIEGYTPTEIARVYRVSQPTISKKIIRLKKILQAN